MKQKYFACLCIAFCIAAALEAQETDTWRSLIERLYSMKIAARLVDSADRVPVWSMQIDRITIHGRTVSVRLHSMNLIVDADFTPYLIENDMVIIEASGKIWVNGSDKEKADYEVTFTTDPLFLGESLLFFPLGMTQIPMDVQGKSGLVNIELEVFVEHHQS